MAQAPGQQQWKCAPLDETILCASFSVLQDLMRKLKFDEKEQLNFFLTKVPKQNLQAFVFQLDEVKDIQEEIARLEYEQRLIDDTAAQVETRLREAMKPGLSFAEINSS